MWKIFDRLQLFIVHFFKGLKFAAIEYDQQLQRTVTPKQRFLIWLKIVIAGIVIIALVIFTLRLILGNLDQAIKLIK